MPLPVVGARRVGGCVVELLAPCERGRWIARRLGAGLLPDVVVVVAIEGVWCGTLISDTTCGGRVDERQGVG